MSKWKITTNYVHTPLSVTNQKDEVIVDLYNGVWTEKINTVVNALIDAHNKEIRELKEKIIKLHKGK